ncbi:hypothetical protein [Ereboglobus luteus]|uniref:Uncharacterized protein n=1 Tax=Ereboglobus luteus TaxID=1796921 RepID=A0A2U8E3X0_9BACT|nr:hypothetical protein [Ereboglobus luteus]AWI09593.1 hypothetical protein CKA38_10360 [Ereboglobus luteus]
MLRRNLNKKQPGDWEVYNLANDIGEKENLASTRADLVKKAVEIFKKEKRPNAIFPVNIPGV